MAVLNEDLIYEILSVVEEIPEGCDTIKLRSKTLIVKFLWNIISFICFQVYWGVVVHKNSTELQR